MIEYFRHGIVKEEVSKWHSSSCALSGVGSLISLGNNEVGAVVEFS